MDPSTPFDEGADTLNEPRAKIVKPPSYELGDM
jgi:hypothetical protein